MTLIIFATILTIVSLVISYFRTAWRKVVLIIGIVGAIVALVQNYKNQQRADDLQKQLSEARRLLPRMLTDEQVTEIVESVRPFAGQRFTIATFTGISEGMNIANRIYDTLRSGNWEYLGGHSGMQSPYFGHSSGLPPIQNKYGVDELPGVPTVGIMIGVEPNAEGKTKNAAKVLADALNLQKSTPK